MSDLSKKNNQKKQDLNQGQNYEHKQELKNGDKGKKTKKSHNFIIKLVLAIVVIVFVLVLATHLILNKIISEKMANRPPAINQVTAIEVETKGWQPAVYSTGLVRPNQGAMLHIENTGVVDEINIVSGQKVKKGDLLVSLDVGVEEASLKSSQARLPAAQKTYQRYLKLSKTGAVSQNDLDEARSTYESLKADIESLKATISRRQIIAPFDGITGVVKVNKGDYLSTGQEVVRVEDLDKMKVDFSTAERNLPKLHVGQKVTVTTDVYPDETFTAKISAIEPAVSKENGLVDVEAIFTPTEKQKLLSGMYTKLAIELPIEKEQLVLPQVAVDYKMYGESVFLLKDLTDEDIDKLKTDDTEHVYKAKRVTVKTKDRRGVLAQIEDGGEVKSGDLVVTGGQQNLSNDSYVKVQDKKGVGTEEPKNPSKL